MKLCESGIPSRRLLKIPDLVQILRKWIDNNINQEVVLPESERGLRILR